MWTASPFTGRLPIDGSQRARPEYSIAPSWRNNSFKMSLEQSVKSQFEKVFSVSDWNLFKEMAEASFLEAAFLKMSDFKRVPNHRKLLARNSRKRLLIGIGTELLLKAIYLKAGYRINKPKDTPTCTLKFPFKPAEAAGVPLDGANTYTLGCLIDNLKKIVKLQNQALVTDGLKIAMVFRNKEGHVVTSRHKFVPGSFRAIEKALRILYADAFHEGLTVRFSLKPREKAAWETAQLT
jgi:hypothetical protein